VHRPLALSSHTLLPLHCRSFALASCHSVLTSRRSLRLLFSRIVVLSQRSNFSHTFVPRIVRHSLALAFYRSVLSYCRSLAAFPQIVLSHCCSIAAFSRTSVPRIVVSHYHSLVLSSYRSIPSDCQIVVLSHCRSIALPFLASFVVLSHIRSSCCGVALSFSHIVILLLHYRSLAGTSSLSFLLDTWPCLGVFSALQQTETLHAILLLCSFVDLWR
jgi:hypothetical protein